MLSLQVASKDKNKQGHRMLPVNIDTENADRIHDYWIDIKNRHIWIHSIDSVIQTDSAQEAGSEPGIEYMMSTRVIKNLHILRHNSPTKPVVIHLHCCGGMWSEGLALYDTIRSMPYHVTMISYTHARSSSSVVFQAADHRIMMPHCYFLMHRGTVEAGGDYTKVISGVNFDKHNHEIMMNIYANKMSESARFGPWGTSEIKKFLEREMDKKSDVYLTAQQAVEWGLADDILESIWDI